MIYVVALALGLSLIGLYRRVRSFGLASAAIDTLAAALLGWLSGVLIGVGARIGMWSIPFFNGSEARFSFDGTLRVILTFSLFGIGLGIVYELLFRQLLRNRGLVYGQLVTAVAVYPLANAALQQISFSPPILATAAASLFFVGVMFIPFAILLELLLATYHAYRHPEPAPLVRIQ